MSVFDYHRRIAHSVNIGGTPLGSEYPIRLQSMTSTSTMDTDASVAQCKRIAEVGASYVRLTAQGVREAENIGRIGEELRNQGINIPLVADIHFNPKAAFAAAAIVQKVRINPGNFVDPGRTFKQLSYTDDEYQSEIKKIETTLVPFLDLCRVHGTAIRIGVNHGSLSDRIMSRYGDTPAGMVESAMEFLRVCVAQKFYDVVISIKASNTVVMVETVRRLVKAMEVENMDFPLHLGVTEAGDGEDGRIKSAVGIGALLSEGIGDTIRVSLSEDPELEIPVAETLVNYISKRNGHKSIKGDYAPGYNYEAPQRRETSEITNIGGANVPIVIVDGIKNNEIKDLFPDYYYQGGILLNNENTTQPFKFIEVDASTNVDEIKNLLTQNTVVVLSSNHINPTGEMQAWLHEAMSQKLKNPVIVRVDYGNSEAEDVALMAAVDLGTMLLNGFADGIWIRANKLDVSEISRISFGILQASRLRITRTEYISCPSCGRTLFDLQTTLKAVKEATAHLKGLKIGVMGCIVNGPGEMADADYGYVGAATGKVSLYKNKTCVEKNIPTEEAIPRLIALIKDSGDWVNAE